MRSSKKIIAWFIAVVIVITMSLLITCIPFTKVYAASTANVFVVYKYDFQDGQMPAGWVSNGETGGTWGVVQEPGNPTNYVFARTNPSYDSNSTDAKKYMYTFGKTGWTDYIVEADVKDAGLGYMGSTGDGKYYTGYFGLLGRYMSSNVADISNRSLLYDVDRKTDGSILKTYRSATGKSLWYAGRVLNTTDIYDTWRKFLTRFDGTKNYFAAQGQIAYDESKIYTPDYYYMAGGVNVLTPTDPSYNVPYYDDANQNPSKLSPNGKVGFSENNGWAYYDNVVVRVKESTSGIDFVPADPAVNLDAPLETGTFIDLIPRGMIINPFDGITARQIDTKLTKVNWSSSDPSSVAVDNNGTIVVLKGNNSSAVITASLGSSPEVLFSKTITTTGVDIEKPLRSIYIGNIGDAVQDGNISMFKDDILDINRLIKVKGSFYDGNYYITDGVSVSLDTADGSSTKAVISNNMLTVNQDVNPGDRIKLDISYLYYGKEYMASAYVNIKQPVDVDVFCFSPPNAVVGLNSSVNLDGITSVNIGNIGQQYGKISGFVTWEIKRGSEIASLSNGSILTVNSNAKARD